MIYVTGDIHGGLDTSKLSNKHWKESKSLTRNDYLIVCGDFGLPFLDSDIFPDGTPARGTYNYEIKYLNTKPYTILFVDGNHENHPFWDRQSVSEWHGGKVHFHPHAENIIHLMRGEIYKINNKTLFAFGGAPSHDKEWRTPNVDWWEREECNVSETENAIANLERCNNKVDIIITHTLPTTFVDIMYGNDSQSPTEKFLDWVYENIEFKKWYAGHFHMNYDVSDRISILYNVVRKVDLGDE